MATKTAVIVICEEAVLIYAIPTLSPQTPDFYDHNPTHIPPLFTIPFPDEMVLNFKLFRWKTISSWYFGSSHPLYFDKLCQNSKLQRFKIMLKPDLSTASLHVINTSELPPHIHYLEDYRICEDTLVSCWNYRYKCGVYTGLTSGRFANATSNGDPPTKKLLLSDMGCEYIPHLCPASGRFVLLCLCCTDKNVAVLDVF